MERVSFSEINYCVTHECLNGGQCISLIGKYNCKCFNETYGTFCQWRTYMLMMPLVKLYCVDDK